MRPTLCRMPLLEEDGTTTWVWACAVKPNVRLGMGFAATPAAAYAAWELSRAVGGTPVRDVTDPAWRLNPDVPRLWDEVLAERAAGELVH